jgi:hypothetical protein
VDPILVAVRSKPQGYDRLVVGIASSKLTGGMNIRNLCLLYVAQVAAFATMRSPVQSNPAVRVRACFCV